MCAKTNFGAKYVMLTAHFTGNSAPTQITARIFRPFVTICLSVESYKYQCKTIIQLELRGLESGPNSSQKLNCRIATLTHNSPKPEPKKMSHVGQQSKMFPSAQESQRSPPQPKGQCTGMVVVQTRASAAAPAPAINHNRVNSNDGTDAAPQAKKNGTGTGTGTNNGNCSAASMKSADAATGDVGMNEDVEVVDRSQDEADVADEFNGGVQEVRLPIASLKLKVEDRALPMLSLLRTNRCRAFHQLLALILIHVPSPPEPAPSSAEGESGATAPATWGRWTNLKTAMDVYFGASFIGRMHKRPNKPSRLYKKMLNTIPSWKAYMDHFDVAVDLETCVIKVPQQGLLSVNEDYGIFLLVEIFYRKFVQKLVVNIDVLSLIYMPSDGILYNPDDFHFPGLSASEISQGKGIGYADVHIDLAGNNEGMKSSVNGKHEASCSRDWILSEPPLKKRASGSAKGLNDSESFIGNAISEVSLSLESIRDGMMHFARRKLALDHRRLQLEEMELTENIAKCKAEAKLFQTKSIQMDLENDKAEIELLERLELKIATAAPSSALLPIWKKLREKSLSRIRKKHNLR